MSHRSIRVFTVVFFLSVWIGLISAGLPALTTVSASPGTILLTLYATEDATVQQHTPNANYGARVNLNVGHNEFAQETLALLKFDLSGIPSGATIQSARLRTDISNVVTSLPMTIGVRQVQGNWSEATVTWNSLPVLLSTVVDSVTAPAAPELTVEWQVSPLVQSWHDHAESNQGLALVHSSTGDNARALYSSESTASARRPRLVIEYTLTNPEATPTPTAQTPSPGSLSGRFFHDQNRNGTYDAGEAGFAAILVYLVRDTVLAATATSDSNGRFNLVDLTPGSYRIYLGAGTLPLGFEIAASSAFAPLNNGSVVYVSVWPGAARNWDIPLVPASPPPAPSPVTLNLRPVKVEIVQINTRPNRFVADKATMVRVHVQALGTTDLVHNVVGRLTAGDATGDSALWRGGIESVNAITVDPERSPIVPDAPLEYTLNFVLPAAWTAQGQRFFTVWVNDNYGPSLRECLGCGVDNQAVTVATFERFRPLNMMLFRVRDAAGNVPSFAEVVDSLRVVLQQFPIDRIRVFDRGVFNTDFDWAAPIGAIGGCNGAWRELIWRFRLMAFWEFDPADDMFWHGFLDDRVATPNGGCAFTDGREGASQVSAEGTDGGMSAAHELGHNQGWRHVACDTPSGGTDPGYPLTTGQLDWSGIDVRRMAFHDKASRYDLMSYCGPRWISQYQYQRALGRFAPARAGEHSADLATATQVVPVPDASGNYLVVAGIVENGAVQRLEPSYRITLPAGGHYGAGTGMFMLEVQDASGVVIFTRNFTLAGHNHTGAEISGMFHEVVPYAPHARRIVVKHAGVTIATRAASAAQPSVQLHVPNGGESWSSDAEIPVRWTAGDADGDLLAYTLQYSQDGGETWTTLASNIAATDYLVSASHLAGSDQALMRVIVSDGLNTSSDPSDATFTVETKAPEAHILAPESNQGFSVGSLVQFDGFATDVEDGSLSDNSLVWSSNRQGEIGRGAYFTTSSLLPGDHTISLTTIDGDGLSASMSVTIFVGEKVYLPLVQGLGAQSGLQ